MTFTITKTKMAIGLIAIVTVAAAAALAAGPHPFNDVPRVGDPDERFYSEPVQWLWDNGLTTGSPSGSDTFKPLDNVTRGEYATFNFRYDKNIVQPGLAAVQADADAAQAGADANSADIATNAAAIAAQTIGLFDSDSSFAATTTLGDLGLGATVTIPEGHTGVIEIGFTAESACSGGGFGGWCEVDLLLDGVIVGGGDGNFAFDSSDDGTALANSWDAGAMTRVTDELTAGTYVVTASSSVEFSTPTFRLDEMVLTAQVHLTG